MASILSTAARPPSVLIDNYITQIADLRRSRDRAIDRQMKHLRRAATALDNINADIGALMARFNKIENDKRKPPYRVVCYWGFRVIKQGPLGPDGPVFFKEITVDGKKKLQREKFLRLRDFSTAFGKGYAASKKQLYEQINKKTKERYRFIAGMNDLMEMLNNVSEIKNVDPVDAKLPGITATTMVKKRLVASEELFLIGVNQLIAIKARLTTIDTELDDLIGQINMLTKQRSGALRLSWRTLNEKHSKTRITGPPGPYWSTLYFHGGERRQNYLKSLSKESVRKSYNGKNMHKIIEVRDQVEGLKIYKQALNNVIVKLNKTVQSKLFTEFILHNV